MTHDSLETAWRDGGAAIGGWVAGGGDFTLDLYRRAGYDYVGIDCQHSVLDEASVAAMLKRTPPGSPATIVRVSKNDSALIGRVVDAGADGIIVPMVDTAEEARAAVRAVRYPPAGIRSFGPLRADMWSGDLLALGDRVSVFVMIETSEGLANVEEICAVPGLAGVDVGPVDLSIGLGLDPLAAFSSDQLAEPIGRIRKACEANDLILGMHQINADGTPKWIDRGVRLASIGLDVSAFLNAVTIDLEMIKAGSGSTGSTARTPYGA